MVGIRAFFLLLLAIVLMILDHRQQSFHQFRQNLSVIVLPIQAVVNAPIQWIHGFSASVTAQRHLLEENAQLKAQAMLFQSKLQKLIELEQENAELKKLLQSTSSISGKTKVAQLLAVDLDPTVQQMIVNKGLLNHVYIGQPVLDAQGVMGQVVDVGPLMSKVLLITDTRSAIPVQNQRNGFRALAIGTGTTQQLALLHINDKSKVSVGDVFVTSGLDLHFPVGYPVGVVSSIQETTGARFIKIMLAPSALFNQTEQVILVWPDQAGLTKAVRMELKKPIPTVS